MSDLSPSFAKVLHQLFDFLPERAFVAHRETAQAPFRFIYANPALFGSLRLAPSQWLGQRPEDVFSPVCGERLQRHLGDCERLGQPRKLDDTLHCDGQEFTWSLTLTLLDSDDPARPYIVGIARDHSELDSARRSAASAHRRLRHLLETSPAVLYACDSQPPWTLNHISRNLSRLLGLDTDAERIGLLERVHPDDAPRVVAWLSGFAHHGRERRALRYRLRHSEGHYLTVQNEARISRPARTGATPELVGTLLDVTREADLLSRLEIMTERIPGLIFQLRRDAAGHYSFPYLAGNDRLLQTIDPEVLALDARPGLARVFHEDMPRLMAAIERSQRQQTPLAVQFRLHVAGEQRRWVTARARPEPQTPEGDTLWHGIMIDVSEHVAQETRLRELSGTDDLTGLANRRRLMQRLDEEMSRARRHSSCLSLVLLDLDHFKRINDTWGHLAGDDVLRRIAELCLTMLRQEDHVARLGGEEFAILLPSTSLKAALPLAERLRQGIEAHDFGLAGVRITASLGLAEYRSGDTPETLIARADRGLYAAKGSGRNRVADGQADEAAPLA